MTQSLQRSARWLIGVCLSGLLVSAIAAADPEFDPPGRVARINLVEGPVSIEPNGSTTWTSDVGNRPLTNGDRVWADQNARVELHVGSTAVRMGSETGITLGVVDDRSTRLQLSAGSLQFRVRALGADETFEVTTPFARIAVLTPGTYRLDVSPRGDELRVATAFGQVAVTDSSGAVTVDSGRQARFQGAVAAAEFDRLSGEDEMDRWASDRDRREDRAVSTRYVSREMTGYEDLDDYGQWQVVGEYGPVWYPSVAADWSPYRYGHWVWISPWGWTWVDDAPWGFAPFHYGRWINVGGVWGWAPGPRHGSPYYAPALVGWVGGFGVGVGVSVGGPPVAWFPLGWNEVYIPSYHASRTYVQTVNVTNIHVNNVTIVNEYYDRAHGDRARDNAPREFRNFGVNGAVVATTRGAFTGGQSVNAHPAEVPHYDHPRIDFAAPNVAPTAASYGRPAAVPPRPDVFASPAIGRAPIEGSPGAGRPDAHALPPRGPEYRPAPSAPSGAAPMRNEPPVRNEAPRNEWRPAATPPSGMSPSNPGGAPVGRTPDYRPSPSAPLPERHDEAPRNEWRPNPVTAAPPVEARPEPQAPAYRPVTPPPMPRDVPRPDDRAERPLPNEWRPPSPPTETRPEPREPEYRPVAPPPMPREAPRPTAAPAPAPAPAARPANPPPKEEKRDRPH
jgi:FecR protein